MTNQEIQAMLHELEKEHSYYLDLWKDAGIATSGDIMNKIKETERKINDLKKMLNSARIETSSIAEPEIEYDQPKTPDQWNVRVYVLTNYRKNIEKQMPKRIFNKIPPGRNSDKLEEWQPYTNATKSISQILTEFEDKQGFKFNVFYVNGEEEVERLSYEIECAMQEKSTIAIIDLLGVNKTNESIVQRFDNQETKLAICPICLRLPQDVKNQMEKTCSNIFKMNHYKLKNDLLCYFSKARERENLTQELLRIFPSKGKIKNHIKDMDSTKDSELRTLNFKLR